MFLNPIDFKDWVMDLSDGNIENPNIFDLYFKAIIFLVLFIILIIGIIILFCYFKVWKSNQKVSWDSEKKNPKKFSRENLKKGISKDDSIILNNVDFMDGWTNAKKVTFDFNNDNNYD